jgi:hypothetical protein
VGLRREDEDGFGNRERGNVGVWGILSDGLAYLFDRCMHTCRLEIMRL